MCPRVASHISSRPGRLKPLLNGTYPHGYPLEIV